jgi:catechol 2,3-dioxygenase-like lactoylglutathione lyase family enzyme
MAGHQDRAIIRAVAERADEDGHRSGAGGVLGIDHVQVAAPGGSEAQARWFYGELLGLPELEKPGSLQARGGVWFACGVHQLHVGIAEPFAPATKAHPALAVSAAELDRLAARLAQAGCVVRWDDAIPDTRRFFTADPWGNRIELLGAQR